MKSIEDKVGRIRDRLVSAATGKPQPAQQLTVAVEAGLRTLIEEYAESAAERATLAWRSLPAGQQLLDDADRDLSELRGTSGPAPTRCARLAAGRPRSRPRRGHRPASHRPFPCVWRQRIGRRADDGRVRHTAGLTGAEVASPVAPPPSGSGFSKRCSATRRYGGSSKPPGATSTTRGRRCGERAPALPRAARPAERRPRRRRPAPRARARVDDAALGAGAAPG